MAALLLALLLLAARVHRATRAAAQARAQIEKRLARALQQKEAVLSPWLEEMDRDQPLQP